MGCQALTASAEAGNQLQVFALVAFRLGLGDGRLAEQVHGERQRAMPQVRDGVERFGDIAAGNEAAGEAFGVAARCPRDQLADHSVARQPAEQHAQAKRAGDRRPRLRYSRKWRLIWLGECSKRQAHR